MPLPRPAFLDAGNHLVNPYTDFSVGIEEYKRLKDNAVRRMFTITDAGSLTGKMQCKPGEEQATAAILACSSRARVWGWQSQAA